MHALVWSLSAGVLLATLGCGGESTPDATSGGAPAQAGAQAMGGMPAAGQGGVGNVAGAGGDGGLVNGGGSSGASVGGGGATSSVTYWQDLVPIFEANCLRCHQEGALGPNVLHTYATAEAAAEAIKDAVELREMPPWDALDDGSCGSFANSITLSDQDIATIVSWADGGRLEGTPGMVTLPAQQSLTGGLEYSTTFTPMPEGTPLALNDEYRCFLMDPGLAAPQFITGYEVVPGIPAVIHHVIVYLVDPAGNSSTAGMTNQQQMQALDDASPERLGWPCFGGAGEGVAAKGVPVTWAPGQEVVSYPGNSGVPVNPTDRYVVQIHYNLANANLIGREDTTLVRLQMADTVPRIGQFVLYDPLLASLILGSPQTLPAGQASVPYSWQAEITELGLTGGLANLQLSGVMPHMHKLGHSYSMTFSDGAAEQCGVQIPEWNIEWQRMYFYEAGIPISHTASFQVTCNFDTTEETMPVSPGWGTANEMCLAVLYFTGDAP